MGSTAAVRRLTIGASAAAVAAAVMLLVTAAAPASGEIDEASVSTGSAPATMSLASLDRLVASRRETRSRQDRDRNQPGDAKKLPAVANAAGEPLEVTDACEENLAIAAKHGLTLPKGWTIHCVGPGLDWEGGSHWGVTCPYDRCPEGAGPYVSISNPTYYVIVHELCHANFGNDELMADTCAAEHGASLGSSPYQ